LTTLLAIDSATDALSLALAQDARVRSVHRVMPRQHQQQLFRCLEELLEGRAPVSWGIDAIVYGEGPGSFTGLRIAASAAQGLAFSLKVPVIGVSTLEAQARTFLRREGWAEPCRLLSTIDARIGQLYAAFFAFDGKRLAALGDPLVVEPQALRAPPEFAGLADRPFVGVGSGYGMASGFAPDLAHPDLQLADLLPEAQDLLPSARECWAVSGGLPAAQARPRYVQKRIGWKTLAEQGRSA